MALKTKTISAKGSTGHHTFTLTVNEDSTSTANNTSSISWSFSITPHGVYDWIGFGNTVKYSVIINGVTTSGTIPSYNALSTITLAQNSGVEVAHNSDGSKNINISFSVNSSGNTTYYLPGIASASDVFYLTDIPRAAKLISAPASFTDEDSPTITYSNPAGTAVSSLLAAVGIGGSQVLYRNLSSTGSTFTFNFTEAERVTLRQWITGSNSKTFYFHVITTIGNNEPFFDSKPTTFTVINATPTLNPTVVDVNSASVALTGNANTMIKGFNRMRATLNAQAYKEATITDTKIINSGTTSYANEVDFTNTNSNSFEFRINDSRNNPVQKTITVPMINYIPLTCNISGSIALDTTDGTKANITFTVSGNYFKGSFGKVSNTLELSYSLEYEGGGTSLSPLTIPDSAYSSGTYSLTYTIPTKLDYKGSYTIRVYAKDKIHDIQSSSKTLKAVPVFDWSENDFNFNVPVSIGGIDIDYPIEQGTKNGWYYRKWNSGFAECWYSASVSGIDVGEFNLNGFYYSGSKGVNFPFTFTEVNYINATGGSTGNMNIVRPFNNTTTSMTYIVMGMSDVSSATVRINLEAKGKWK